MASLWMWLFSAGVATVLFLIITMVFPATPMRRFRSKIRRSGDLPRSGTLKVLSKGKNAKFEIIAVHGLGAHPHYTWTAESKGKPTKSHFANSSRVHLLQDLLVPVFPEARVLSFECNSTWLFNAPKKTTEEIGKCLLKEIKRKRSSRLPIIFIGHSLGGIIIKQALCGNTADKILEDTSGIIFLGTPHQGSSLSSVAAILAFLTRFLGSDTTLLLSLRSHQGQLSNLRSAFQSRIKTRKIRRNKIHIFSFYETMPLSLGWFSMGLVVSRDSAAFHADEEVAIETDHSHLNKCSGSDDELFTKLTNAINVLRTPSLLEEADALICNTRYTAERLKIERLSGESLAMDQCYINLAIVKHSDLTSVTAAEKITRSYDNFLLSESTPHTTRATDEAARFDLQALFNERVGENNQTIKPRRILIRGRPGVGKTTLCKNVVHDFIKGVWPEWNNLFDRVLWVPLRNLKRSERRSVSGYNFESLFGDEYFSVHMRNDLATEMALEVERDASRTLFLLDGLDEVSEDLMGDSSMASFLEKLLRQPSVIITSRPCVKPPPDLDLELETIGFYHEQIINYVRAIARQEADSIESFLQKNSLLQSLASIPIQLDALCYAWQDVNPKNLPKTMTTVYSMIEKRLWKKDVVKMGKSSVAEAKHYLPNEIRCHVRAEIALLELLAFNGLYRDIVDFTPAHRDKVATSFSTLQSPLDKTLEQLSFLRTSDPSSKPEYRNYHFIHLTFQEYFAALYFVRHWTAKKKLEVLSFADDDKAGSISPIQFLREHKYTTRYGIFWRFVAGLLDIGDLAEGFINKLEEAPIDLLGPTHQRLIMRCLSEICGALTMREGLERRLSQWLRFEWRSYESAWLAREIEFPEKVLEMALFNESPGIRAAILDAGAERAIISSNMIEQATTLLSHKCMLVREAAVKFIGRQSASPEAFFTPIIKRLHDPESRVRIAAIEVLESQPLLPDEAITAICNLCCDAEISVRAAAFNALGKQRVLPDELIDTCWSFFEGKGPERREIREATIQTLINRNALPKQTFIALLAKLDDGNCHMQRAAIRVLGGQSALPHKVLMTILTRLDSRDRRIQDDAIAILGRRDALPNKIYKAMIRRLDNKDSHIQYAAIQVLSRHAWPNKVYTAVVKRLDPMNSHVRRAAIQVLGSRRVLSDPVVEALVELLRTVQRSPDSCIQNAIIATLGNQIWLPQSTLSVIAAHLSDEKLRKTAISALSMRSNLPSDVREAMSARLSDNDPDIRVCTIYALPWQSAPPTEALMFLVNQLDSEDDAIFASASYALIVLGRQFELPRDVRLALIPLVSHDYEPVRYTAICVLGNQALQGDELQEFVAMVSGETSEHMRLPIIDALAQQSTLPIGGSHVIAALLHDSRVPVRHAAAEVAARKSEVYLFSYQVNGLEALYTTLQERSFKEHISLCQVDGKLSIRMPDGVLEIPYDKKSDLDTLQRELKIARPAGMPSISSIKVFSDEPYSPSRLAWL